MDYKHESENPFSEIEAAEGSEDSHGSAQLGVLTLGDRLRVILPPLDVLEELEVGDALKLIYETDLVRCSIMKLPLAQSTADGRSIHYGEPDFFFVWDAPDAEAHAKLDEFSIHLDILRMKSEQHMLMVYARDVGEDVGVAVEASLDEMQAAMRACTEVADNILSKCTVHELADLRRALVPEAVEQFEVREFIRSFVLAVVSRDEFSGRLNRFLNNVTQLVEYDIGDMCDKWMFLGVWSDRPEFMARLACAASYPARTEDSSIWWEGDEPCNTLFETSPVELAYVSILAANRASRAGLSPVQQDGYRYTEAWLLRQCAAILRAGAKDPPLPVETCASFMRAVQDVTHVDSLVMSILGTMCDAGGNAHQKRAMEYMLTMMCEVTMFKHEGVDVPLVGILFNMLPPEAENAAVLSLLKEGGIDHPYALTV